MSHVDWFLLEARIVRSSHIATSGLKREFVDDRLGVKLDRSDVAARHYEKIRLSSHISKTTDQQ
jgi:hypothetical protein